MARQETDTPLMQRLWDVPAALVLLTRLPLPPLPDHAFTNGARAVWAYPLVGLGLGAIISVICWGAALVLPPMIVAGLVLGALVLLTGAMHEDGLADTADGLWGGNDPARRLEIMKDSRIGAYGVLALILVMGLRWLGIADVGVGALVAALVISRALMTPLMLALPHARDTGLAHSVGRPDTGAVIVAVLIAALCALILAGGAGLVALIIASGVAAGMGALARAKIGGQTGDILGATQICTEIAVLLTLTALT
ncbi:adenosylcobinamide-GDP ribazoletransferase [Tateyamaria armeniaca]|uniref:Adenosylcobinamide-GDP ribazoletransferase n=1 Tax=Tateyamaria armeniaca TaxID=2518930 RepID=A0ABW8UXN7_9RHOB